VLEGHGEIGRLTRVAPPLKNLYYKLRRDNFKRERAPLSDVPLVYFNTDDTMKYTYHIECPFMDGWNAFTLGSRHYCNGYMDAMRGQMPRVHLRLVRSDGKVMDEVMPKDDVGIGMVAGWPTAEQYETAADWALERAGKIRERTPENN